MRKKNERDPGGTGLKMSRLRKKRGISLEDLAELTGISMSRLRDIEEGKGFAPVSDILCISRVLSVEPERLMMNDKQHQLELKKRRAENFNVRAASYNYTVLTPAAKNSHLRAFRITIPPRSEHPKVNYRHEGEEFIYVIKGEVEVRVGQKVHLLRKDDSLHFNSNIKHSLKNLSAKKTELIVTLYTP